MALNNAAMIMPNGSDDGSFFNALMADPRTNASAINAIMRAQTLFQDENSVEGSPAYLSNMPRDAAFEEILHITQDAGIGVDELIPAPSTPTVRPGVVALVPFQAQISHCNQ